MNKNPLEYKKEYLRENVRKRKWKKIVSVLACVVVFYTTYALILPAITLTGKTYCGIEEHAHSDSCYKTEFICQITEEAVQEHTHSDDCYQTEQILSCSQQETEGHTHTETCISRKQNLICSLEESEEHVHTEACYTEKEEYICGQQEQEPHGHGDNCWTFKDVLICNLEEGTSSTESHNHTESCYKKQQICNLTVHTHGLKCYSDPKADVETAADWEKTLPEKLTGIWRDDVITVAESQLGYRESTANYDVDGDGDKKGYSRYGDWYGNKYGDWCAMFVSFCLNYADIPKEAVPYHANCQQWTEKLTALDMYQKSGDYIPEKGDLIFFEVSRKNISNHVGLVVEVMEDGSIKTIEGNASDKVKYRTYDGDDGKILGYGVLTARSMEAQNQMIAASEEEVEIDTNAYVLSAAAQEESIVYTEIADAAALNNAIANAANGNTVYLRLSGEDIILDTSIQISSEKHVVIDLNGRDLSSAGNNSVFHVNGGNLAIEDSTAVKEAELQVIESTEENERSLYGNLGVYAPETNNANAKLVYYVTASEENNIRTGATTEQLEKHEVEITGKIKGGTAPIIKVSANGTFTLNSGALVESKNRAILSEYGVVNLNGGYICGNSSTEDGGAIYCDNAAGVLQISGTVVAANSSAKRGGGIKVDRGTLNISNDAVISGNHSTQSGESEESATHYGGGGIFCWDTTLNMDGGYITNNVTDATGYFDGGGGILASGNTKITITNGFITGNKGAGGGGVRTDWNNGTTFKMNGGFICANYAVSAEGGGISINSGATATILAGYINNNITDTTEHWGGGGLFCSNGSKLFVRNVLITQNSAMGFGGGVAGCSTGRVYITVNEGGAIYHNSAEGDKDHMSGSASTKNEDHHLALNDSTFMESGYEDYFCALNSVVEPKMLGGQPAYWTGSKDGDKVSAGENLTLIASSVMGLTANPNQAGIDAAEAEGVASLYVNGNSSNTHGGGILANGYLIVGEVTEVEVAARIELSGTKAYYTADGTPIAMEEGEFRFSLTEEKTGAFITEGTNDANGNIVFENRLPFTTPGKYVYLLKEENPKNSDIIADTSQYRITVFVKEVVTDWYKELVEGTEEDADSQTVIKKKQELVERILVEKKNGSDWITVSDIAPNNSDDSAIKLNLTTDATFTNYKFEDTDIKVVKEWEDGTPGQDEVLVHLYRNGEKYDTVSLTEDNNWSKVWKNLPVNELVDGTIVNYTYTVQEDPVPGYQARYETYHNVASSYYWVPATELVNGKQYLIVYETGEENQNPIALYFAENGVDKMLTTDDKMVISKGTDEIRIAGKTYQNNYFADDPALKQCILTAKSERTNEVSDPEGRLKLINYATSRGLLIQKSGEDYLKGGSGIASYISLFEPSLANGLTGHYAWNLEENDLYSIIYDGTKFNAVQGDPSGRGVTLYTKVAGAVTGKEVVFVITNIKEEAITYGIDMTKVSYSDPAIKLEGAYFVLKNADGEELFFNANTTGSYTFSEEAVDGTTKELVTGTKGKLVMDRLPAGKYILEETKAPVNYKIIEPMEIVLGEDPDNTVLTMEVADPRQAEFILPKTGGPGNNMFIAGGIALMAVSLFGGWLMSDRRRERRMK